MRIARQFQPDQIILFGSYAYGEPTSESDVDLLVVMPLTRRSVHKEIEIRQAIRAPFALDLLVRSSQQTQQRLDMGDFFIRDVVDKGRVIYEADYARVGQ
ncbi:MAG: nucleotidyltransferase domain-containing protein [Cyanobacteria bacterium J06634_5]